VNDAANLRIILHEDGQMKNLGAFHCVIYGSAGVLALHVAEKTGEFSPDVVRNVAWVKEIKYQDPPQDFTVIGPSCHHGGKIVAVHLRAVSWESAVSEWREGYAPYDYQEDPTVLEGFQVPLTITVIPAAAAGPE
jgi:hypothetical protein